jgi:hypothetical protein
MKMVQLLVRVTALRWVLHDNNMFSFCYAIFTPLTGMQSALPGQISWRYGQAGVGNTVTAGPQFSCVLIGLRALSTVSV